MTKKQDKHASREASKYDNPIVSREWILALLNDSPLSYEQIARAAKLETEDNLEALRRRLKAMVRDGQLIRNRRNLFVVLNKADLIRGVVIGHRDGFGFVKPDDGGEDLYLSSHQMSRAMDGDEVIVRQSGVDRRGRKEGSVVEVVKRANDQLVGRFVDEGYLKYVLPDNPKLPQQVVIPPDETNNARDGEMVVVEMISYPTKSHFATAKITHVLGDKMAPGMEIEIAIKSHRIPSEWPSDVVAETERLPTEVSESETRGRIDLRQLPFVTIDGEDAKDFDDAVYAERRKAGGWRLWVAIADVSNYVRVNSALDIEAFNRGNSTYFPGFVVPMLPEALSNGLCSLNPNVDRLTMVCEMTISERGRVSGFKFFEGVIHSHARLTYNEVATLYHHHESIPSKVLERRTELETLHEIYTVLRSQRDYRGAIDFESPEPRIIFNAERKVEKIVPVERNDAHKVIEECMLAANVSAAKLFEKYQLDALFRVHEGPKEERLESLRSYLRELGLNLHGGAKPQPSDYQALLQQVSDRPDAPLIQSMMLRSMAQAQYRADNEGHFGLAYEAYTHFTSPIRRYPDLLVHRAIRFLSSSQSGRYVKRADDAKVWTREDMYPYELNQLIAAGEQCSMTERRSDDASRDVMAFLKCEFLSQRIGDTFSGRISAVTNFGFFVELDHLFVEGLVHISNLPGDYYHYDQSTQRLVAERTKKAFNLGDQVDVLVASVDLDDRKVDLELVGHTTHPMRKSHSRVAASDSQRRKPKSTSRSTKRPAKKKFKSSKRGKDVSSEQTPPARLLRKPRRR
jgi:ribonuclease R